MFSKKKRNNFHLTNEPKALNFIQNSNINTIFFLLCNAFIHFNYFVYESYVRNDLNKSYKFYCVTHRDADDKFFSTTIYTCGGEKPFKNVETCIYFIHYCPLG